MSEQHASPTTKDEQEGYSSPEEYFEQIEKTRQASYKAAEERRQKLPKDWLSRLCRHVHPTEHRHIVTVHERELLPWVWAAVKCDPHNLLAYQVGTYWLAQRLGRKEEALRFVLQGIEHNPDSFDLELALAEVHLHAFGRTQHALEALVRADRKWRAAWQQAADTPHDTLTYSRILLYLGTLNERLGRLQEAERYFVAARPIAKAPEAVDAHLDAIRERRRQGEGE